MITIKADVNHLDAKGRLLLEDLAMHRPRRSAKSPRTTSG